MSLIRENISYPISYSSFERILKNCTGINFVSFFAGEDHKLLVP